MTAPNNDQDSRGISLLEAEAAGIPVVTTDERGVCDAAERGSTGCLSSEGTAQGMVRNIVLLTASRQMRRDCSHRGRARLDASFGAERTWERLQTHLFNQPIEEAQRVQPVDGVRA
jgi:glycosyltransferase involved in cell wall biosynthesis